jgi:hypothetical protein
MSQFRPMNVAGAGPVIPGSGTETAGIYEYTPAEQCRITLGVSPGGDISVAVA